MLLKCAYLSTCTYSVSSQYGFDQCFGNLPGYKNNKKKLENLPM